MCQYFQEIIKQEGAAEGDGRRKGAGWREQGKLEQSVNTVSLNSEQTRSVPWGPWMCTSASKDGDRPRACARGLPAGGQEPVQETPADPCRGLGTPARADATSGRIQSADVHRSCFLVIMTV